MSIYKFVTDQRIDILENLQIRFTPPIEFNDPFELYPYLETVLPLEDFYIAIDDGSDDEFVETFVQTIEENYVNPLPKDELIRMALQFRPIVKDSSKHLLSDIFRKFSSIVNPHIQTSMNNFFGIMCSSGHPLDIRMWGHYTNNHKGFVIVFDENHDFFQQKSQKEKYRSIREVSYTEDRPRVNSVLNINYSEIFFTKSKVWDYEREWRLIRPLSEADKIEEKENKKLHFFNLPPECIEGVIFGVRTSEEVIGRVKDVFKGSNNFKTKLLSKTVLSENEFSLGIKEINTV